MTAPVPRPAYAEQLAALLPTGRAWETSPGTVLGELIDAHAEELARFDFDATALLLDMLPSQTTNLIEEWETAVGLPDACSPLASNLAQRRAAVRTKLVNRPNLNPTSFEAVGALFGVPLTVAQHDQARADAATMLDTNNGRWRFVWFVEVPASADDQAFTTLSDVLTPLLFTQRNTELECRLQALAPSHSLLVVEYVAAGFGLNDFALPAGRTQNALMLITAGLDGDTIYRHADSGAAVGSLDDGSDALVVGAEASRVTRIRRSTGDMIRVHDNPETASLADVLGAGNDPQLHIQTAARATAWTYVDGGSNFANFTNADADDQAMVAGIAAGDAFIAAVTTAA